MAKKGKVTIKKKSGRTIRCTPRTGPKGGKYVVTRKKGGGVTKRYV